MTVRGSILPIMAVLVAFLGLLFVAGFELSMLRDMHARVQAVADIVALGAASGFIDGDAQGDSVRARAAQLVAFNPIGGRPAEATVILTLDSGVVSVRLVYLTPPLLIAPNGVHVGAWAVARARPTDSTTEGSRGTPMPRGNAWGWWNRERVKTTGPDSALVQLIR